MQMRRVSHYARRISEQLVFGSCLHVYHALPDFGERQNKSRTPKRRFVPGDVLGADEERVALRGDEPQLRGDPLQSEGGTT